LDEAVALGRIHCIRFSDILSGVRRLSLVALSTR
jgi:hypothetical protein